MEPWNKASYNKEEINLDTILRQTLECSEKPDTYTQAQLMAMLGGAKTITEEKRISLWWLPAVTGTVLTAAVALPAAFIMRGSILGTLLCFAEIFFCANSWFLTFVGVKKFNLKEAASL